MDFEDASDKRGCHKLSGNVNCSVNNGGCSQTCTDLSDSGYYCSCQEGYKIAVNDRKSCEDVDECARWGTYCAQQCKNVKGSYKCLCTDGFHDVKGKGTHCKPKGGQLLIFFTSGHEVRQVIPDKKAYSGTLSWGRHMGALDVDVDRRLLYFSDLSLMKIERAGIPDDIKNGGPPRPQDLNADVTQVEGIAIDWVTNNIYWTDSSRRTISVALDDGRYQKTLIRDDLVHPLAIIVNPKLGLLYWTDAGSTSPKIEQAWMTGEERSVLVFTRLGRPTGLTLDDHMDDRLYWCDSKENLIESIKLDGSDRVIVVGKGEVKGLDNPVSLDVFGDSLYWASQQMGAVMKMDKFGRGVNVTLQTGLLLPSSVRIMHPKRHNLSVKNQCSDDDGEKCSHLCLLKPDGAACACPDRSQFIDDSTTQCDAAWESSKPSPSKCSCLNISY
ncbi:low-density lipoprotein receptor-related protein 2-like isoform X1 [Argopecten irradians]|uniref:low-density lipoprotein receptor-related protein 2-like isoform X1 n=1 Tax=Argopecten irradians TaxID=31199 RepID=UPI00371ED678